MSLAQFEPRVSPDLAGFDKGAEAQLARYKMPSGEAQVLLLSYPTPQIAGERFREFETAFRVESSTLRPDGWSRLGCSRARREAALCHLLSAECDLE